MAYNFRERLQKQVQTPLRVIYDDPSAVPIGRMSFSVTQSKKLDSNGVPDPQGGMWSGNYMGFARFHKGELWVDFKVTGSDLWMPKQWEEVAINTDRHDEMLPYHNQYRYNVPEWMWSDLQMGLSKIENISLYKVGDIGVINGGDIVEIQRISKTKRQGRLGWNCTVLRSTSKARTKCLDFWRKKQI